MIIGNNIQKYRKFCELTQKELAQKCGVATGTIQQYELGKRKPKFEMLCKIAEVLVQSNPLNILGITGYIQMTFIYTNESYFLTKEQARQLPPLSIEQVKILIRGIGEKI